MTDHENSNISDFDRLLHEDDKSYAGPDLPEDLSNSFLRENPVGPLCPIVYYIGCGEGWKNVLELGTGNGVASAALNGIVEHTDGHVITVDTYGGKDKFVEGFERVTFLKKNSTDEDEILEALKERDMLPLDCVFIDADHRSEAMQTDYEIWRKHVRPEGFMMFHDVCVWNRECEGPRFWNSKQRGLFRGWDKLTISFSNGLGVLRKKSK